MKRATPKTTSTHGAAKTKATSDGVTTQHEDGSSAPAQLDISVSKRSLLSSQSADSTNVNETVTTKQVAFGWDSPNSAASSTGQSVFTFGDDGLRESVNEDDLDVGTSDSKTSSQIVEEGDLGLGLPRDQPLFDSNLNFYDILLDSTST